MTKILHVCSGKGLGGTRTVFLAHQKIFEELGVAAKPIIRRNAAIKATLERNSNMQLEEINYLRRFPIKLQTKSYNKMKSLADKSDIIWVHKPIDCYIWRLVAPRAKIVMVVHGFQNTNLEKADYLIAVSVPVFKHLEKKGLKNIFLINNFLNMSASSGNISWNKTPQISSFGFFRRKKGFLDLVESLNILQNKMLCNNFRADIYGNGRLSMAIKTQRLLKKVTNLKINGWTNDVKTRLQNSDIVIIPSRSESFSMIAIEGMSQGCLVVSTKCGGPEHIITDGVDGILVAKRNPLAMAKVLSDIIMNPNNFTEIRENARKMVVERFSITNSKAAMTKVLELILS